MKVSELTDTQLNYLAAKAQGWVLVDNNTGLFAAWQKSNNSFDTISKSLYKPTHNGQQAMELVEKFKLMLAPPDMFGTDTWICGWNDEFEPMQADTPQRAICMAVIASVYGDEVNDE